MIPLNQTYRESKTFEEYPDLKKTYDEYIRWCLEEAKWHKYGRAYDCSVSLKQIDFKDKIVCELGARDSIFCSYLTKYAKKVYASDIFEGWGDLGSLKEWTDLWEKFAFDKDKLVCERQDMTKLTYADNSFDVVISFSAIEHIFNGDTKAATEMARVCKPGGKIIIGTEITDKYVWNHGSYFYDLGSLFERIITPTGCEIMGDYNFDYESSDIVEFAGTKFTSCIFVLEKK